MASFPRKPWKAGTRKAEPWWILMKQDMMGWQWHQLDHKQIICNFSRQITTAAAMYCKMKH